jgi:prevent-host-death family protein
MSVRTVDIADAIQTLAEYARQLDDGPIVVTSGGQPLAAVVSVEDADLETLSLSMDPQFMEIIQRSRARGKREGGVAADEVERKFGHVRNSGDG